MNEKKYDVHIIEECVITLEKHIEFIANVNANAAEKFRNEFFEIVRGLEIFPERNTRIRMVIAPNLIYHRALIGKYHALLYEIQGNDVYVDLVIDLRQNNQFSLL